MTKYEYKTRVMASDHVDTNYEFESLQSLGNHGWELCCTRKSDEKNTVYYFKRPLPDTGEDLRKAFETGDKSVMDRGAVKTESFPLLPVLHNTIIVLACALLQANALSKDYETMVEEALKRTEGILKPQKELLTPEEIFQR